jgi:hypothetical protein
MKPRLVAVEAAPQRPPEESLHYLVPHLAEIEDLARRLKIQVAEEGRRLAKKRGVVFIREEHLRREFGGNSHAV